MGPKKKKTAHTMELKKELIAKYESGVRVVELAKMYDMKASTIDYILKRKKEIKEANLAKGINVLTNRRSQAMEYVEKLLLVWLNGKKLSGITIPNRVICKKAKQLHEDIIEKMPQINVAPADAAFKASRSWLDRFKTRSGLREQESSIKVEPSDQGPSDQGYPGTLGTTRRTRNTSATSTVSSVNSLSQPDSLSQPSAAKFQKKSGRRPKKRGQKPVIHSVQPSLPTPVPVAKRKPVQRPRPEEKRIFLVVDHQRHLMSNLAALWERGKLCDAVIGNGLETVMVHKLVLSAMCPKLLSVFDMDILSNEILQVNFPAEVSTDALNAFAEYMYKGILDLDCDILEQLKIIAKRLDMIEFEQLCDSHLPNHMHQPDSAESFSNVPLIQTTMPVTPMTSFEPAASTSMQSAPPIPTQVVNIKQEITEDGLAQAEQATTAVYDQELVGSSLAPNKFENTGVSVIRPTIKTEPVGPEDEKYGHLDSSISNQPFTLTALSSSSSSPSVAPASSTSIAPVPASSTEFSIPFIEKKDVKSTKLKATHSYDVPAVSDLSNGGVYPVGLFSARGDNLPLLTTHTSEDMKIHPFIPSEKT